MRFAQACGVEQTYSMGARHHGVCGYLIEFAATPPGPGGRALHFPLIHPRDLLSKKATVRVCKDQEKFFNTMSSLFPTSQSRGTTSGVRF